MTAKTAPPTALEPAPAAPLVPDDGAAVRTLLTLAVEKNLDLDKLERLVSLQERVMDRQAAAEFFAAMAEFQAAVPPIRKTSVAKFVTKGGATASYSYAELDEIARTVNPILAKVGLSYSWDSTVKEAGVMVCTCTLRHRAGHAVTAQFGSKIEGSPLMSGHQATAATLTYARRQSLVQVLGLTTCDPDTDGADDGRGDEEAITEEQAANLAALMDEVAETLNRPAFFKYYGIEKVAELRARDYADAVRSLERKRKAGK